MSANPLRGEAAFTVAGRELVLRPTFTALVAAEEELGPLLALAERATRGELRLTEIAALLWHCLTEGERPCREEVAAAVVEAGLVAVAKPLRKLLTDILKGAG